MGAKTFTMAAGLLISALVIMAGGVGLAQKPVGSVTSGVVVEPAIRVAVNNSGRSEQNRQRDQYRHPVETLSFFGVKPEMTVVELWPGGGWYTEILAPLLAERGKLIVTNFNPAGPRDSGSTREAIAFQKKLDSDPKLFGKVQVAVIAPPDKLILGPDGSADMVLTFRNIHNWVIAGFDDKVYKSAFKVLKSGGVLGIEEHRAANGVKNASAIAGTGYMPESYVIQQVEAAGFKFAGKSEINANPKDTKDYKEGVWTLPPTFTLGDKDRDRYLAIGESDRMTLKFVKP